MRKPGHDQVLCKITFSFISVDLRLSCPTSDIRHIYQLAGGVDRREKGERERIHQVKRLYRKILPILTYTFDKVDWYSKD